MNSTAPPQTDLVSLRSRVNWGAIVAGGMITFTISVVLGLFATATGLSSSGVQRPEDLRAGALLCAVIISAIAFFAGGWTTTHFTIGENYTEAVVHGAVTWGVVVAILLMLTSAGIRAGFNTITDVVTIGDTLSHQPLRNGQTVGERAAVPPEAIDRGINSSIESAGRLENSDVPGRAAAHAAWWALLGTVISLIAVICGALIGAGRRLNLVRIRRFVRRPRQTPLTAGS